MTTLLPLPPDTLAVPAAVAPSFSPAPAGLRWHFLRRQLVWLGLAAVLLLLLNQWTDLDVRLTDYYYDFQLRRFPWRDAWLTAELGHRWLKYLFQALGLVLVLHAVARVRQHGLSALQARRAVVLGLSILLIPALIASLKRISALHCPWDIVRWGGDAPFLRLLDAVPAGVSAGQCFPAGHASSALWLLGLAAYWLPHAPRRALLAAPLLLTPGLLLGWMQQMRGAHLLSHTLASLWLSWLVVSLLSAWLLFPQSTPPRSE